MSFFVTTELDTIMGQNAYGYFYEIEELAIIARHFRPGSIMLDVGANIGNHTIYAAKFLGARRIICIEPNPEAIMILRINVDLNQLHEQVDMRYLGLGLSDSPGAAVIARTIAMNLGGVELASQAGGSIRLFAGDELLQGQPIDFIKIDVEGMELAVLKGLERTIAECCPGIFVEVDNAHAPAFHALIQHLGYAVVDRFNRYGTMENFMLVPSEETRSSPRRLQEVADVPIPDSGKDCANWATSKGRTTSSSSAWRRVRRSPDMAAALARLKVGGSSLCRLRAREKMFNSRVTRTSANIDGNRGKFSHYFSRNVTLGNSFVA